MNISTLSKTTLEQRLKNGGLLFRTGPITIRLQSSIAAIAEGLHLLYGEYTLVDEDEFIDFHVRFEPPRGLRRWYRPQVEFEFDGHRPFKPLPYNQAFAMFEWALNWCVANHYHHYLIIHAAVIEKDGRGLIMPAPPGSGKSTLCAALVNRGWRLFSDELALISLTDGMLVPLPRPVGLKNESIDIIAEFAPQAVIGHKAIDTAKGTVAHMKAPTTSIQRSAELAPPAWLIFPKYEKNSDMSLVPHSKAHACVYLAENSFNYNVLGVDGFHAVSAVIDQCACYDFTYSCLDEAVDLFDSLEPPG